MHTVTHHQHTVKVTVLQTPGTGEMKEPRAPADKEARHKPGTPGFVSNHGTPSGRLSPGASSPSCLALDKDNRRKHP